MYLSSLPEAVGGIEAGDRTDFPNGVPNPSDKALLKMGLQQDVVHSGDSGLRRYIIVGITRNQDNRRDYVAAA